MATDDASHSPVLLERLRAVHDALDEAGFDHAFGGAIALGVHAEPRFTSDIDINVIADPAEPGALLDAMPPAVVVPQGAVDEVRARGQIRLLWPDPRTPIDLFLPQHPTYHQLVNDRAVPAEFLGAGVHVITATDLMVFKMLFNRRKDWADIETLLAADVGDPVEAASIVTDLVGADDERLAELRKITEEVARRSPPTFPRES